LTVPPRGRNKALFLDRDGVVNVEKHYVHKRRDFEFMEGIIPLCARFQTAGFWIVIVTNQSGIAQGLYPESAYLRLNEWMLEEFACHGVAISGTYHCPHHPEFSGNCDCRKPKPGMILRARDELDLDLTKSVLLGDKERDLEAGRRAGITHLGLVHGHTRLESIDFDDHPGTNPDDLPAMLGDPESWT
jgi:D-glycero-D-manno-heptose 1,7-bisphosphate phosphatase